MGRIVILAVAILLFASSTLLYRSVNRGLSSSSKHQMLTRLGIASLIAMLPALIAGRLPAVAPTVAAAVISLLWSVTYPLQYHLTHRKNSPEYDNQMDIASGFYFFGALTAGGLIGGAVGGAAGIIIGGITAVAEVTLLALIVVEWGYFAIYGTVFGSDAMQVVQATNINEVFEYIKLYGRVKAALTIAGLLCLAALCVWANIGPAGSRLHLPVWIICAEAVSLVVLATMIFSGRKSPWRRCGLASVFLTVADYRRRNSTYAAGAADRLGSITATPLKAPSDKPGTIVLVIGESANRDYMSAYTPLDRETTPWLSGLRAGDPGLLLFPNAYSCAMVTINSLERALTERNQYNDKPFSESASIIDMARKLGMKIHWYSNQGHLGAFDTQVSLVAETSDVAKWTNQQLNRTLYDESLLEFLPEVNPAENNLLVVHLKGSHFPFANRFPAGARKWGGAGDGNLVVDYMNSIRYTDSILQQIFDYARKNLNMQAMVYCSDHATIPDRTRTPGFMGFGMTRIPLFVWLSENYRLSHPERAAALTANCDKYFTNDLLYELMCGIFDIKSNCFDETSSLASAEYKYTRDMLLTYDGTVHISDDNTLPHEYQA